MINNRELVLIIGVTVAFAALLLHRGFRSSVARASFSPVIAVPILLLAGWVVGLAFASTRIHLWDGELTIDATVWFFGTALVLLLTATQALSEERFFRRTILGIISVGVFVEVFVNLYVFSLWIELALLPALAVLLMLSVVAGSEQRFASVKALIDTVLGLIGLALIAYVVFQIATDWQDFDRTGALRKFALPVWLTIGVVPFVYLFSLYFAYDGAFRQVDFETNQRRQRWRVKVALVLHLRVGIQDIAAFRFYWAKRAAAAPSFRDATQVIDDFKASRRADQRAEAEAQDRLRQYAGVDGADEEGRRLDQREFRETTSALRWLATAQMGRYRNRGGRYRPELMEILKSGFEHCGLPPDHGITLWVADDGQSWWAYRRTVTGWCFAIGAADPPSDEWLYDGPEPPTGPPGEDPAWGERWGIDAKNW